MRLCLAEKGLAFESRIIDLTKMEHHSPAFLKLNPNGVIPLLMRRSKMSVPEIAAELGYADPSAFYRACVEWTGAAPRAYRARLAGRAGNDRLATAA